jgi:prepilin signal peptidase PulO-like enzyme (type II secretory pathway)
MDRIYGNVVGYNIPESLCSRNDMEFKSGDLIPTLKCIFYGIALVVLSPIIIWVALFAMIIAAFMPLVILFHPITWVGMFLIWFNKRINSDNS